MRAYADFCSTRPGLGLAYVLTLATHRGLTRGPGGSGCSARGRLAGTLPVCYTRTVDWTEIVPFIAVLGVLGAMWWRLNSRIDTLDAKFDAKFATLDAKFDAKFATLDAKFDAKFATLHKLLTDNLLALNRDIGELKGAAHTHTPD